MKINETYSVDFFYSSSTYAGVYVASTNKLIGAEDSFVNAAKEQARQHIPDYDTLQVIKKYNEDGTLKSRVNITMLLDLKKWLCIGLLWFDDDNISIEESLKNINDEIDWSKAREFDF